MTVAGFDEFPDELRDTPKVFVECAETEHNPDACGDWFTEIGVQPPDVMMDNRGYLHFGSAVPTECEECENEIALRYNGVTVVTPI